LNLYKPVGLSSRQALDRVEEVVAPLKVGHAGTLDPIASGVLLVCVGQATRAIEHVQKLPKKYRGTFLFGRSSASDDTERPVTIHDDAREVQLGELQNVLPQFTGTILQTPPAFSAVKIHGRRSYKIARKGRVPNLSPREVRIDSLKIVDFAYPELTLEIECGSGTYVRALGRDLAKALGTSAVMSALERTAIGPFTSDESIEPDGIWRDVVEQKLHHLQQGLPNWPRVVFSDEENHDMFLGRGIPRYRHESLLGLCQHESHCMVEDERGRITAILAKESAGTITTETVFRPDLRE
jgi:tRNA pseudouridine55 synthase